MAGNDKEPRKKRGRFIGKNSPLIPHLKISNFSLKEICTVNTIYPDNVSGTIIHSNLHLKERKDATIKPSRDITKDLTPESMRRPVLKPMDFTDDWARQKDRMKKNRRKMDEEDELEREMEFLRKSQAAKDAASQQQTGTANLHPPSAANLSSSEDDQQDDIEQETPISIEANTQLPPNEPALTPTAVATDPELSTNEDQDTGHPIFAIKKTEDQETTEDRAIDQAIERPDIASANTDAQRETSIPDNFENFIPMDTESETESIQKDAIEAYKTEPSPQEPPVTKEELRSIREIAEKEGFDFGFQQGEQKARLQITSRYQELTDNLQQLFGELEHVKKDILRHSEENFRIVCQTMIESILKREFELNPRSFRDVITRAIEESVPNDQFQLKLNPTTYKEFQPIFDASLVKNIVTDDTLGEHEFKIESELKVVDGRMSQVIGDLLDQTDLSLFNYTEEEKVS